MRHTDLSTNTIVHSSGDVGRRSSELLNKRWKRGPGGYIVNDSEYDTLEEIVSYLNKNDSIIALKRMASIGKSLNSSELRFTKAAVMDRIFADIFPMFVLDNQEGYDMLRSPRDTRISNKSGELFYQKRAKTIKPIALRNTMNTEGTPTFHRNFDYIFLFQTVYPLCFGVIPFDNIIDYIETGKDQIKVVGMPASEVSWVVSPFEKIDTAFYVPTKDIKEGCYDEMIKNIAKMTEPAGKGVVSKFSHLS